MYRDEAAEALAEAEFFEICDDEQRRMLAFAGDRQRFAAGDVLYAPDTVPQGAIVLISGSLEIAPEGGQPSTVSQRGSVVAAMGLILAKPRPLTVTAITDSDVLIVPRHAFMKLVQQSPDLAQRAAARLQHELSLYLGALEPVRRRMKPD
jgi:CRP-like cAMP-binding protein